MNRNQKASAAGARSNVQPICDVTEGDQASYRGPSSKPRPLGGDLYFLLVVTRGQEHEAQEAVQGTMLHVARRARTFQDEEAFWCWLKAVARNAARDGGRKQTRYRALLQRFFLVGEPELSSPRAAAEDRLKTALAESLNELAPEERRLVEAKYLDGAAVRELSTHAGLSEKAIESRLLRLRRWLRERLLKKLNEP